MAGRRRHRRAAARAGRTRAAGCWPRGRSLLALLTAVAAPPAAAQREVPPAGAQGWDSPEVAALVQRAVERRGRPFGGDSLRHYSAQALGTVRFMLEGEALEEPVPLRVDQVAVDLYWQAPDRSRQVVRAQRKRDLVPIRDFAYYADRLTLVQEGFGERITIGDERDVRGVLHPLSRSGPSYYHYRVARTVVVRVPGLAEPVRVIAIEVRPRDPSRPAFVGEVSIEAETAALVRMRFTFTPAAYADPRNERIDVMVEHGLWEGRHWLPYLQELEVRRQVPELDLGVSSVIRARLVVRGYDFETPVHLPPGSRRVVRVPGEGDTGRFDETLDEVLAREGANPLAGQALAEAFSDPGLMLRVLRSRSEAMPPVRLYLPSFSTVLRANRAEGAFAGAGLRIRAGAGVVTLEGGYAAGAEHGVVRAAYARPLGDAAALYVTAGLNAVHEIEPAPGGAGLVNTVATLLAGRDWTDPYYVDRAGLHVRREAPRGWWALGVDAERHTSAVNAWSSSPWTGRALRPVLTVSSGTRLAATGSIQWRAPDGAPPLTVEASASGGTFRGRGFGRLLARGTWRVLASGAPVTVLATLRGGLNVGEAPPQHLFLPGGTRTLPGIGPAVLAGSRFVAGGLDAAAPLGSVQGVPLSLHAALNGATVGGRDDVPARWPVRRDAVARASATVGIGVYGGMVRIDWSHGLPGRGEWRFVVSPRLAPLL